MLGPDRRPFCLSAVGVCTYASQPSHVPTHGSTGPPFAQPPTNPRPDSAGPATRYDPAKAPSSPRACSHRETPPASTPSSIPLSAAHDVVTLRGHQPYTNLTPTPLPQIPKPPQADSALARRRPSAA